MMEYRQPTMISVTCRDHRTNSILPAKGDKPLEFGPFWSVERAEECLVALANRSDVLSATIETKAGE